MGCLGSKPVQQPVDTNPRTQTRQKTAARPSGTARQHTSARQPSSQHASRSGHPPSSRNRKSDTRHRTGNRHQTRLPPLDEQPEDVAISDAVRNLATLIEGHSRNYYPRTKAFVVIGRRIVNHAIMGDDNLVSITDQISSELRGYQSEYSEDREAHLQSLVEEGRRIRGTIAQYRGKWSFGAWDEGVKFPSLLKNGVLVTEPRH